MTQPEPPPIPLLDLAAQLEPLHAELLAAVEEVLQGRQFINGPQVQQLEQAVAALSGCAAGVGVSSGTDALLCGLMALGVGPGDEVITTPYTFFATAGSIWRTGARPVFVDIDPETFNLDPQGVAAAVTVRTRAVMPVHLFGQMADMDPLVDLCRDNGLYLVEDAAQAIGATYRGRPAGSLGTLGCLSFFPSKNLGALGDAGMMVTTDEELGKRLRIFRAHGASPKYFHAHVGGNFRLDTLQAALLLVKLPHLEGWSEARRQRAARYDHELAGLEEVQTPVVLPERRSVFNQYVIRARGRDALRAHLAQRGVPTQVYYPRPLHLQRCFASLGHAEGDFPHSERAAAESLALPLYPELSEEQIARVTAEIRAFYRTKMV